MAGVAEAINAAMRDQKQRDQWDIDFWLYCRMIHAGTPVNKAASFLVAMGHFPRFDHLTYDPFTFKSRRF